MAETAAWLVDCVIPKVSVRQWVLSFPIPLRSLFAVHPEPLTPVLLIIHRALNIFLIKQAGIVTGVVNPPKNGDETRAQQRLRCSSLPTKQCCHGMSH